MGGWLRPLAVLTGAGVVCGCAIGLAAAYRARALELKPGDPWNLSPPLVQPVVTGGWGNERSYRCPCVCEAGRLARTTIPCDCKSGGRGVCECVPIHEGLDFEAARGTPVLAMADGKVVSIDRSANSNAGRVVRIQYDNAYGLVSEYLHLSRIDVIENARVRRLQPVALSGDSGQGDGAFVDHLHITMRLPRPNLPRYIARFGRPDTKRSRQFCTERGFGSESNLGVAIPGEPLIPAVYSAAVIKLARERGVARPRQIRMAA